MSEPQSVEVREGTAMIHPSGTAGSVFDLFLAVRRERRSTVLNSAVILAYSFSATVNFVRGHWVMMTILVVLGAFLAVPLYRRRHARQDRRERLHDRLLSLVYLSLAVDPSTVIIHRVRRLRPMKNGKRVRPNSLRLDVQYPRDGVTIIAHLVLHADQEMIGYHEHPVFSAASA